ncbi:MAG TPA: TolC family protein [Terriglobia bacterium]|nr:TolC family protein [Terriglobia bacterium]
MKLILRFALMGSVMGLVGFASGAYAQDTRPTPVSTERPGQIDLMRSGPSGALMISLDEAISLALERNPSLVVEKIHLEQARERVREEKGRYDPLFNFRGYFSSRDNIVASRFYPTGLYVDTDQSSSAGVELRTYSGGKFNIGLDFRRLNSTSNTQTLSPQYSSNLTFAFTQSLLRDFGRTANTTRIQIAQKAEEVADRNLFQRVSELVQQIEGAYWNLVFLQQNLDYKRRSLEAARNLLNQSRDLFAAGRVAQVSVLEARAGVASREEELITAENEVHRFEDRMKLLLWVDLDTPGFVALDQESLDKVDLNADRSLLIALQRRPELQGLQKELEQRQAETRFAANQTLPRLDLVGQYGTSGLSGLPNLTCVDPTASLCVPVGASIGSSVFADQNKGVDALSSLFLHNYNNWSVELKLQIPLGNRSAKAQLADANLRALEANTRLNALRDQIALEIRDAIRETQTAQKRIDAARENITFLNEQLDDARKRFEAGLASSYEVLQVFDDLDRAKANELKAIMDFRVGQSKLRLAEASVLDKYDIEMKKPPRYTFEPRNLTR